MTDAERQEIIEILKLLKSMKRRLEVIVNK
jgi:hypothetical protein